ncbi:uncharacterized protein LOC143367192 [Andrena cerasifolii]|uniref:uncharacterized protein LOC143367192 n=1 Tax=Andrena cerasifolii TaxID=2819439 RepID=UPI0040382320
MCTQFRQFEMSTLTRSTVDGPVPGPMQSSVPVLSKFDLPCLCTRRRLVSCVERIRGDNVRAAMSVWQRLIYLTRICNAARTDDSSRVPLSRQPTASVARRETKKSLDTRATKGPERLPQGGPLPEILADSNC